MAESFIDSPFEIQKRARDIVARAYEEGANNGYSQFDRAREVRLGTQDHSFAIYCVKAALLMRSAEQVFARPTNQAEDRA